MTRLAACFFASLSGAALLAACGTHDGQTWNEPGGSTGAATAEDYRNGVPRSETVAMTVPETAAGQALVPAAAGDPRRGETAGFYKLTRAISHTVNGGGLFVLVLVKTIVSFPPTTMGGDSAVWGPWSNDLDKTEWKLTVTRVGAQTYKYALEGRDKKMPAAAFTSVLTGEHTPALNTAGRPVERFGNGTFELDFDARASLPDPDPDRNVGKAKYRYSRLGASTGVEVDALFRQVKDDEHPGQRVDADYLFRATPGTGGSMEFTSTAPPNLGMAGKKVAVRSRWQSDGAGRSDVRAKGGDAPPGAEASECWDSNFDSQFLRVSWAPLFGYGNEATDCVFKTAELPQP